MNEVVGVVGGSGGVGATHFAAALATAAAPCLLLDLDALGGGIDVALGLESVPGARWSGLRVDGGTLDPTQLCRRVPHWGAVAVLAADCAHLDAGAVREVVDAARKIGRVIVDLPRAGSAERTVALEYCDLVVVVARADVAGLVAAHAVTAALPDVPTGLVVRKGEVSAADAARLVGCSLLGELPPLGPAHAALSSGRLPRASKRLAAGVLHGLDERAGTSLVEVA